MKRIPVAFLIFLATFAFAKAQDAHFQFGITSNKERTVELAKYLDVERSFSDNKRSEDAFLLRKPYKETVLPDKVKYESSGTDVQKLVIPHTAIIDGKEYKVTSISEEALAGLSRVTSIEIPSSVECINKEAFKGCASLNVIRLGKSVRYIDGGAFSGCTSLRSIQVDAGNAYLKVIDDILFSKDGSTLIYVPLTRNGLFVVPPSVRHIGDNAFERSNFTEVILSEGVETIGNEAFGWSFSLYSVQLPSTLRSIGSEAFIWTGITKLVLPDSLVEIGEKAFYRCKQLSAVTFGSSLRTIGEEAFSYCPLSSLYLPKSVESIGEGAFAITPLEKIIVEPGNNNYRSLDDVLFNSQLDRLILYPVAKARSYSIPEGVVSIGKRAFDFEFLDAFDILNHLVFPTSVKEIEDFAFVSCRHLKEIELPVNLKRIGTCGLYCSTLEAIVVDGPMPVLGEDAVKRNTVFYVQDRYLDDARQKYPMYKIRTLSERTRLVNCSLDDLIQFIFGQVKSDKSLWSICENDVKAALEKMGAGSYSLVGSERVYSAADTFCYQDLVLHQSFPSSKANAIFDSDSRLRQIDYAFSTNRQFHELTKSIANQLIRKGFRLEKGDTGAIVSKGRTTIVIIPDPINECVFVSLYDNTNSNNEKELEEMNQFIDIY